MAIQRTGKVQTVLGLIEPEQMGITTMHEHIFIDFQARYQEPPEASRVRFGREPVSMGNLYDVKRAPFDNIDNLYLLDEQEAIDEVMQFKLAGGSTIVDTTTVGLGRDPRALTRVARITGLHITMGAGYYIQPSHPADMDERSEDAIYAQIVRDIEEGVDGSGIRCGHIGEIGCEQQHPNEMKVVRAAARAQRSTGAMLNVHQVTLPGGPNAHRIADEIEKSGGDLRRTVFSHLDVTDLDLAYQESLLERGITLEYDTWGMDSYLASWNLQFPSDRDRLRGVLALIEKGWIDQVVLAQDISLKIMREKYGGWGYGHILKRIVPRFRLEGLSDAQITTLLVDNPRRLLPFVAPRD